MYVREAQKKDEEQVKQLVSSALSEYGLKAELTSTDRDLNNLEAHYTKNGGYFGVVTEDNEVVATIGIFRINDKTCELRKLYTAPNQRGKGLGKALLDFAMNLARKRGFKRITLETTTTSNEAIGLYKGSGFKEFQPPQFTAQCDRAFECEL
ncbi:hypothetical protein NBRC116494_14080 [Aurantivibrio plasticivorans]